MTLEAPAQPSSPFSRAKLRGVVSLATLAVSGLAAPMTFGATGAAPTAALVASAGGVPIGGTGLQMQVAIMDDHHHSGSTGTKPSPWCSGAEMVGPGSASGTTPILFYGGADNDAGCSATGWDTPGVWIKNPTGVAVTVDLSVSVPASPQTTNAQGQVTNAGNHAGRWSLWSPVTLQPGQSVIFAQTGSNNFDPGDTNHAGKIGADPAWCSVPSKSVPTITVTVNGAQVPVADSNQILNTGGVDSAGCVIPSADSATRSDESVPWQNP